MPSSNPNPRARTSDDDDDFRDTQPTLQDRDDVRVPVAEAGMDRDTERKIQLSQVDAEVDSLFDPDGPPTIPAPPPDPESDT